jgi:hypothetical protein
MPRERVTNLELQKWIVRRHGFVVESAWIEQSKERLGLRAPLSEADQLPSCPPEKLIAIQQAFKYFGILP